MWAEETREWLSGFEDRTGRKIGNNILKVRLLRLKRTFTIKDYLFVSSSIWDVNRWGPLFEESYKNGLANLVSNVPTDCSFFWLTTPQGKLSR